MKRIFVTLIDQQTQAYPKLSRCFEKKSYAADFCKPSAENSSSWATSDYLLVLEDVAYSFQELFRTGGRINRCKTKPGLVIMNTVYYSDLFSTAMETMNADKFRDGNGKPFLWPWTLGNTKGLFSCPMNCGLTTWQECFIYFDHKVADEGSLGEPNMMAIKGMIYDKAYYTNVVKVSRDRGLIKSAQPTGHINFIPGCQEVNGRVFKGLTTGNSTVREA